jgi:hypothetical protein
MARIQGGGGGAVVAAVVLGCCFFICMVLAVLFYTQISGAEETRDKAVADLAKYVDRQQAASDAVKAVLGERQGRQTVVGILLDDSNTLKQLVSGDPGENAKDLNARIHKPAGESGLGIEGSLLAEISRLNAELNAAAARVATAEKNAQQEKQRADAAQRASAAVRAEFDKAQKELESTVVAVSNDARKANTRIDDMGNTFTEQLQTVRTESQVTVKDLENQLAQIEQEKNRLQRELDALQGTESMQVPSITSADGQIVSVIASQKKVYINRGSKDRLLRGMTFEVFDPDELVKLDEYGDLRGKATIEVIGLADNSAVARIARSSRKATIKDEDIIVNIAYDPNATLKFHVFGEFDIDNRNEPSRADRRRVEAMIVKWGGKLADTLGPDIDFLVLGREPGLPHEPPLGTTDPVEITKYVEATRTYETYQNLKNQSLQLSVPILNQNRFLTLIGYYQR